MWFRCDTVCTVYTHAGELLLLQVHRHQNETPLLEPATETAYGGRRLVAVATHRGAGSTSRAEGGHWRCHIRQGYTCWVLDSLPAGRERPDQSNPFLQQHKYKICMLSFKWGRWTSCYILLISCQCVLQDPVYAALRAWDQRDRRAIDTNGKTIYRYR